MQHRHIGSSGRARGSQTAGRDSSFGVGFVQGAVLGGLENDANADQIRPLAETIRTPTRRPHGRALWPAMAAARRRHRTDDPSSRGDSKVVPF